MTYSLALYAHLLLLATLLAGQVGQVWFARAGARPGLEPAVRGFAVRAVLGLGVLADVALVLMFAAGFELARVLDAYRLDHPVWRAMPWMLPAVLLVVMRLADRAAARGGGRVVAAVEGLLRGVWGMGQVWDGASVIFLGMTHMLEARWLAAKLAIFGLLLLTSIPARRATLQLRRETVSLLKGGASVAAPLHRLQWPLLASALLVLAMAWLGTAKPT
ncbi:MAG: hypothetical protein IT486_02855 [Gammaproteobacteria bacterium]|nr:hypothetical protein [Gammaproteobacteria bacterium]